MHASQSQSFGFVRAIVGLCVLSAAQPFLSAQVEEDPVTVPVFFCGTYFANPPGTSGMSIQFDPYTISSGSTSDGGSYSTPRVQANMRPGKDYYITVNTTNLNHPQIPYWYVEFDSPAGTTVFVENLPFRHFVGSGTVFGLVFKVRLADNAAAGPGQASDLRPGRVIWSVGVGSLVNGEPAGVISLREQGLTANTYKPSALIYDTASPEVERIYVSSILRQVFAPQCLVDIVADNDHAFRLKYFARAQIGARNGDGTLQTSGTPYVEYLIENSSHPSTNRLKITKTSNQGGTPKIWWTEIQKLSSTEWKVIDWTESGYGTQSTARYTYGDSDRDETIEVRDSAYSNTYARTKNRFSDYAWGRELTRTDLGYGGSNPLVSTLEYHNNSGETGNYGKTKWKIDGTGNWERYEYYTDFPRIGLPRYQYRPFGDAPSAPSNATAANCALVEFDYCPDWRMLGQNFAKSTRVTLVQSSVSGTICGKTEFEYNESTTRLSRYDGGGTPIPLLVTTKRDYSSTGSYLTTIITSYREDADAATRRLPGRPHTIQRPDGTMEAHLYFRGNISGRDFNFDPNGAAWAEYVLQGTTSSAGGVSLSSYGPSNQSNFIANNFYVVPGQSTMAVVVRDFDSTVNMTQSWVYANQTDGWVLVERDCTAYIDNALPNWTTRDSGDGNWWWASYQHWGNGRVWRQETLEGITTDYTYDAKGRISKEQRYQSGGVPAGGDQWTIHTYDPADRETETKLSTNGSGGDPTNDVLTQTDYDLAGRVTQTRRWGESDWLRDYYYYFVGSNPRVSQVTHAGGGTTIEEVYLDGRAKSVTGTAQAPKYFSYWLDVPDGYLNVQQRLTSGEYGDRWTNTKQDWLGRSMGVLRQTTAGGYAMEAPEYSGAGQLAATYTVNWPAWTLLLAPTRYTYNTMGAVEKEGLDVGENGTLDDMSSDRITKYSYAVVLLDGAWWKETTRRTLTNPANGTDGVVTTTRERLTARSGPLQAETRVIDANGQTTKVSTLVDRTNRTVEKRTEAPGSAAYGQDITTNGFVVRKVSTEGVATTYEYDQYGRVAKEWGRENVFWENVYWPKSPLVKHRRNAYLRPQVIGSEFQEMHYDAAGRRWKVSTNNVGVWRTARYEYNAMGQVLHQWGDAVQPAEFVYNTYGWRTNMRLYRGATNLNSETWPSGSLGTADTTTWAYHGPTGLVTSKTDPANRTVSFTYNARNQVATRTWGRGVVTTYAYCESAGYRTGELASVSYNDGTPTVNYYYDDWASVVSRTGRVMRILDAANWHSFSYRSNDQQPQGEWLDWNYWGVRNGNDGRVIARAYDGLGRPSGFDCGWGTDQTAIQQVRYYFADLNGLSQQSGRLSSIYVWNASVGGNTFSYGYRSNPGYSGHSESNLIASLTNDSFQRTSTYWDANEVLETMQTTWSGASKASFVGGYDWVLQTTDRWAWGTLPDTLSAGPTHDHFSYTQRGELDWVTANQWTWNGSQWVDGAAINNRYRDWTYDTAGNRDYEWRSGATTDFVANNLNQYTAADFALSYDYDGNLVDDGVWTFAWDAENRLTVAQKKDNTQRLELTYDYLGRRVRKTVRNGGPGSAVASDRKFLYDGWTVIAELDAMASGLPCVRTFAWGLDATGTIHGGGGVGGLLQLTDGAARYLPLYDQNGNVHGLLDGSGNLAAGYSFSAFGEVLNSVGSYAASNPIRFASKWYDEETGLYQYNHRYYSPRLGRFISRDPVAENGGLNLYGYCGSDPVGQWDYLGQFSLRKIFKKLRNFVARHSDPLTSALVRADQRLDDWTFRTLQKNPWIVSVVSTILSFTPFAWVTPIINASWTMENGGSFGEIAWSALGNYAGQTIGAVVIGSGGGFSGLLARNIIAGGINGGVSSAMSGGRFWNGFKNGAATAAAFTVIQNIYERQAAAKRPVAKATDDAEAYDAYLLHNVDSNRRLSGHNEPLIYDPDSKQWLELTSDMDGGFRIEPFNGVDPRAIPHILRYERAIKFRFTADQARGAVRAMNAIKAAYDAGALKYNLSGAFGGLNCTTASVQVLNAGGAGLHTQGIWNQPQAIFDLNRYKGTVIDFGNH